MSEHEEWLVKVVGQQSADISLLLDMNAKMRAGCRESTNPATRQLSVEALRLAREIDAHNQDFERLADAQGV